MPLPFTSIFVPNPQRPKPAVEDAYGFGGQELPSFAEKALSLCQNRSSILENPLSERVLLGEMLAAALVVSDLNLIESL